MRRAPRACARYDGAVSNRVRRIDELLASRGFLLAVLALAAALRVAHVLALRGTPFFTTLQLDHQAYDEWARRIARGVTLRDRPFFVDPLYAYVLGGIYAVAGRDLLVVRLVQAALGVATCALTARLGRRVLGSAALANVAALLVAIYVPEIHHEAAIEKTGLGVFLLVAAATLYFEPWRFAPAAAGAALGLATLARGNVLVLVPFGALALALARGPAARQDRLRRAGAFAGAALAVIGLATAHNLSATGELVLTTANAGQNLYLGQHRGNADGTYAPPPFLRPDPRFEEADFRAEAERRLGRRLGARETSAFWTARALDEIAAAPGAALLRTWRKLRLITHTYETPDNDHLEVVATASPVLRAPVLWMGQLLPFALLGAVVLWRRREARLVTLAAVIVAASVLAFFVLSRFRAPIVPILAVLAAGGGAWLVEAARARAWRRAGAGAALVAAAALWSGIHPGWLDAKRRSALAVAYHNLGAQRVEAGDVEGGLRAYERAVATDEASVPASRRALGELYLARGEYGRAERHMRRVVEMKPSSRMGHAALVRLYEAMRRDPRWRDDPVIAERLAESRRGAGVGAAEPSGGDAALAREHVARARALAAEGRHAEAIAALKEAVRVGPYDEAVRYMLGNAMEAHATPEDMIAYFGGAAASDPKPQTSLYFWAVGLERAGDADGAIAKLAEALEVDPAHEMSEHRWGAILEAQGRYEEALAHYRRAVEIFPEYRAAHEQAARLCTRLGREAEAAEHLERARASDPLTPRRFVYWARYLAKRGRRDAAIAELERALRANPDDAEALALLAELKLARPGGPSPTLVARLSRAAAGSPVWIAVDDRDPGATALAAMLRAAFVEAGWTVRAERSVGFPLKPGVYVFAADETPPAYVAVAEDALRAEGLSPIVGTGYRAYYADMRAQNPSFRGFAFAPDQTWLLVIGRP